MRGRDLLRVRDALCNPDISRISDRSAMSKRAERAGKEDNTK